MPDAAPLDLHEHSRHLLDALTADARARIEARWHQHGPRLLSAWMRLYGDHPAHLVALEDWLPRLAECANARAPALCALDAARAAQPRWCTGPEMLAYSCYVDRFGGTLEGVRRRVPYLQSLGVRYLHLLPFFLPRAGDSDGGFAVRDFEAVDPRLGTLDDLEHLCTDLRAAGISLCADLVLNHTADDHRWALAARAGDPHYRDFYRIYPDRSRPDAYERTLTQVFPATAPGNYTEVPGLGWVWTTFYPYQWDLNWKNPAVFAEMSLTLLRLANRGVEVFRMDSAAFLWKRLGGTGMNEPEAHLILQALRALVDLFAPGVLLKAEAIVPVRELPPYFGLDSDTPQRECHLAYHSSLMTAAWAGLALQRGDIPARVLRQTPALPPGCAWISYLRCHDDIGWNVLVREAAGAGGEPFELRAIAAFYAGEQAGSYARGERFQSQGADSTHGSNGMLSALVGMPGDAAMARYRLLFALLLASPGIPLIYMGDEYALGNDEAYRDDPARRHEGRWLHRPAMDWETALRTPDDPQSAAAQLRQLLTLRRALPDLAADAPLRVLDAGTPAALLFERNQRLLAAYNFSDTPLTLALPAGRYVDVDGRPCGHSVSLPAYGYRWCLRVSDAQSGGQA